MKHRVEDIVAWAEEHVRLPGSARCEVIKPDVSPWTLEPLRRSVDGFTRTVTLVKPIQSGGSTVGEILLCYWLSREVGSIHYNWEDDEKAKDRWDKRVERILRLCDEIRWPLDRFKLQKCLWLFPNGNLTMQGVYSEQNLDSESVRFVINEEVHNWEPGRLAKAKGRTTAYWNATIVNISNAGKKGDQLYQEWEDGTMQYWEVGCPGCGQFHRMHTRFDPRKPELGGLRYDADGCRMDNGRYDYNRLAPTIRYQMPCGFEVREDPSERRALSLSGKYSQQTNPGADGKHRSYTYEAVAVDYIPWIELIKKKHLALFARQHGDPEPWRRYITEQECGFYDVNDVPIAGKVKLTKGTKKNREGIKDRKFRLAALDRQQGDKSKGELPHWWLLIRDVAQNNDSQLVFEGKVETDENAAAILKDHGVNPWHVVADSGDDTDHVYAFCMRYGYNAIKGGKSEWYADKKNGTKRTFSDPDSDTVHKRIGGKPMYDYEPDPATGSHVPDYREPRFIFYGKHAIREKLNWWRSTTDWRAPEDVSEDYQSHMEAEERQMHKHALTHEDIPAWVQVKDRNDLFVCEAYIALQMDMANQLGGDIEQQTEPGKEPEA